MPTIPASAVLDPAAVYAVQRTAPPGPWHFPEHDHRGFLELLFVESGHLLHLAGGGRRELGEGGLVLVREHDRHALETDGARYVNLVVPLAEWRRLRAYLDEPALLARLDEAPLPPSTTLAGVEREHCAADLRALFATQADPGGRRRLASLLLAWLPALAAGDGVADARPPWLRRLLAELDQLIEEGVAPAHLARRAGVAPAHLARSFRRHCGCTPTAWLTRRRLERAALFLARSDRPVEAVAAELGFASRSWFHRAFRAQFGATPAIWRRRHAACCPHPC